MEKKIEIISPQTIETIKNKSAYRLPNNPSERNMKAEEIKGHFWKAEFDDGEMSIMGQLKKLINRLNEILPHTLDNTQIVDNCVTADDSKVASANQLVVLKNLIDNFDYNNLKNLPNLAGSILYENVLDKNTDGSVSQKAISEAFENVRAIIPEVDENGIMKLGDIIIPQRKVLWEGYENHPLENSIPQNLIIELNDSINIGDVVEIEWSYEGGNPFKVSKFRVKNSLSYSFACLEFLNPWYRGTSYVDYIEGSIPKVSIQPMLIIQVDGEHKTSKTSFAVSRIVKIIE